MTPIELKQERFAASGWRKVAISLRPRWWWWWWWWWWLDVDTDGQEIPYNRPIEAAEEANDGRLERKVNLLYQWNNCTDNTSNHPDTNISASWIHWCAATVCYVHGKCIAESGTAAWVSETCNRVTSAEEARPRRFQYGQLPASVQLDIYVKSGRESCRQTA